MATGLNYQFRQYAQGLVGSVKSLAVTPATLDFPATDPHQSSTREVTVRNTGTALVTFAGISMASGMTDFNQTNNCSVQLAAGPSCAISVMSTPSSANAKAGSLLIVSDASQSPQLVEFTSFGNYLEGALGSFSITAQLFGDAPFTLTPPLSDSAGAISYASDNPAVATVSGNLITIAGVGSAAITATQSASGDYSASSTAAVLSVSEGSPVLTNLLPSEGPPTGGNTVVLSGARFRTGMTVTWNGAALPAGALVVESPTRATVIVPPNAAGAAIVSVSNTAGTSAAASYTYIPPLGVWVFQISAAASWNANTSANQSLTLTSLGFMPNCPIGGLTGPLVQGGATDSPGTTWNYGQGTSSSAPAVSVSSGSQKICIQAAATDTVTPRAFPDNNGRKGAIVQLNGVTWQLYAFYSLMDSHSYQTNTHCYSAAYAIGAKQIPAANALDISFAHGGLALQSETSCKKITSVYSLPLSDWR